MLTRDNICFARFLLGESTTDLCGLPPALAQVVCAGFDLPAPSAATSIRASEGTMDVKAICSY